MLYALPDLPYITGQEYLRKALNTSEDTASIVFLNLTATLLLHATLFLLESTTVDWPYLSVSVYTN